MMSNLEPSLIDKAIVNVVYDLPPPEDQPNWRLAFNVGAVNSAAALSLGALAGVSIHQYGFPDHATYDYVSSKQERLDTRLEKLKQQPPSEAVNNKITSTQISIDSTANQLPIGYDRTTDMATSFTGGILTAILLGAALSTRYPYVKRAYQRVHN